MTQMLDLAGQTFGRLSVARRIPGAGAVRWECHCACGARKVVATLHLRSGAIRSCGCLRKEVATKHGLARSSENMTWRNMRARCNNPKSPNYAYYGGRGIKVCDRWDSSFEEFVLNMGLKPSPQHTIDRINNDGNYEPGNCRWALMSEQATNKRPYGTASARNH